MVSRNPSHVTAIPPAPPAPPPTPSQIESRNQKRLSVIRHIDNRFNRIEELVVLNDKSIYLTDRGEWLNSLRSLKDQLDCSSVDPFTVFIPQAKAELSHQFAKDPVRLYHSLCAPFEQLEEFVKLNPSLLSTAMRPEWLQKFRKLKDQVTTTHAVKGVGILSG